MVWGFLSDPLGQCSQIIKEQASKSFLNCRSWAVISCHPVGVGSGSGLWDFSDLSEGQISCNPFQLLEEAQLLKDWPRLSSCMSLEPLACLPLLQLAREEEEVALEVVAGSLAYPPPEKAPLWQYS